MESEVERQQHQKEENFSRGLICGIFHRSQNIGTNKDLTTKGTQNRPRSTRQDRCSGTGSTTK